MNTIWLKTIFTAAWIWLSQMLMPVSSYLLFTVVLVLVDLGTGVAAARHRGEELRSRGFSRSVLKIALYCAAILLSHGMDKVFFEPKGLGFDLVWIVAGLIGVTEFKSNLENISTVTGSNLISGIADRLPGYFKLPKNDKKEE